jgi:hypothetical protein
LLSGRYTGLLMLSRLGFIAPKSVHLRDGRPLVDNVVVVCSVEGSTISLIFARWLPSHCYRHEFSNYQVGSWYGSTYHAVV